MELTREYWKLREAFEDIIAGKAVNDLAERLDAGWPMFGDPELARAWTMMVSPIINENRCILRESVPEGYLKLRKEYLRMLKENLKLFYF